LRSEDRVDVTHVRWLMAGRLRREQNIGTAAVPPPGGGVPLSAM
jgi:hypothetical protein